MNSKEDARVFERADVIARLNSLTLKQRELLTLFGETAKSYAELAEATNNKERTIDFHFTYIRKAFGLDTQTKLLFVYWKYCRDIKPEELSSKRIPLVEEEALTEVEKQVLYVVTRDLGGPSSFKDVISLLGLPAIMVRSCRTTIAQKLKVRSVVDLRDYIDSHLDEFESAIYTVSTRLMDVTRKSA